MPGSRRSYPRARQNRKLERVNVSPRAQAAASCIARCDQMLAANLIVFEPWPSVRLTNPDGHCARRRLYYFACRSDIVEEFIRPVAALSRESQQPPLSRGIWGFADGLWCPTSHKQGYGYAMICIL